MHSCENTGLPCLYLSRLHVDEVLPLSRLCVFVLCLTTLTMYIRGRNRHQCLHSTVFYIFVPQGDIYTGSITLKEPEYLSKVKEYNLSGQRRLFPAII